MLDYSFISVRSGGSLEMISFITSSTLSFSSSPMVSLTGTGSQLLLVDCSIDGVSRTGRGGVIEVSEGGQVEMKETNVSSITSSSDCAVLSCVECKNVNVTSSNFSSISRS